MLDALPILPAAPRGSRAWLAAAAAIVAAIALAGTWASLRFVATEGQRDLRALQLRYGSIAEARAASIADWVARQREALRGLGANQTLQLYLTELALAGGDRLRVTDEPVQAAYVRSLVVVAAERMGFAPARHAAPVNANVPRPDGAGIAVLDPSLRVLMATGDMPSLDGRLRALAEAALRGPVFDLVPGPGGRALFVAAAPVAPLQGEDSARAVGVVFGMRDAEPELFQLLDRPPALERSAETLLIRRAGNLIEFLSPLRDGTRAFGRSVDVETPGLAESFALSSPGGFALRRNLRDGEVVVVSRAVAETGWVLVHKVDRSEALGESDARLWELLLVLLLAVGVLALLLIAVWRHGASRRATRAAEISTSLARRFEVQSQLLRLVTDNQSAEIFIVGGDGRLRFANRRVAERVGGNPAELEGKRLASIFGPAAARHYEEANRMATQRGAPQTMIERAERDGKPRLTRTEHVPITGDGGPGVLVVEEDITAAIIEREKRERILQQVVNMLVRVVDRRDPFAADHSERVAAVARAMGEELDLPTETIDTTETAGRLMNLGKALVPEALLTRDGKLTAEETRQVRAALQHGVDLLTGIEFGGPVVETLRQAPERWDGKGPRGLAGEEILMPARIIAVANAFVAMVSPRAHRPGADMDAALATIMGDAGHGFDRRIIAALVNIMENRGGRARFGA